MLFYASFFLFFFNDTATTEIYTLSLHDALPISSRIRDTPPSSRPPPRVFSPAAREPLFDPPHRFAPLPASIDRKSTRLNSSHLVISYAVFCLKKKKKLIPPPLSCPPQPSISTTV